jgi:disaggregatase-related protein/dockerin type I repeat protein
MELKEKMRMEKIRFLIGSLIFGFFLVSSVSADIIWNGVVSVESDFTVPAGETLMIEPNTVVQVAPDVTIEIRGRIDAQGTASERIQFILAPGETDDWEGIHLEGTTEENTLSYVDISGVENTGGTVGLHDSRLLIEHCTLSGGRRQLIYTTDSSLHVRHCTFPDRFGPGEFPGAGDDNVVECIKGSGILPGGNMIIENNLFGKNMGHNDVIDFSGPTQPGPILRVLHNVFLGAGDECLDLGGDAYIEGNVFMHVHKDQYNTSSGQANVISTGDDNVEGVITCVRNIFYDIDYVIDLKNDTFLYFHNNVVAKIPPDATNPIREYSAINFVIPNRAAPGKGAYLKNNIFWDIPQRIFGHVDEDINGNPYETDLEMHYCLLPSARAADTVASRTGTIMDLGQGNLVGDPLFADPNHDDFHLMSQAGRWQPDSQSWVIDPVTSIAIDTGNPGTPLGAEYTDPANVRINLGAYGGTAEASQSPPAWGVLADINNDGIANGFDFSHLTADWLQSEMELSTDLNRDGLIDNHDLELLILDWLQPTGWF